MLEYRRITRRAYCFRFTRITDKKSQFAFKNLQFSTFATFLFRSLSSLDADFCISSAYVTSGTKRTLQPQGEGCKQKKHEKKKHEILPLNPYYKRSDWNTWLSGNFFEAIISKLWNKKNICCRSLDKWSQITGKSKVGNTTCAKLLSLIGQKQQNSFQ